MDFAVPRALPFYLVLGVLCGFVAVGFSSLLYWVEDIFEHLPVDEMWWPAIGGLVLGVIGYFVPRVLGVGYDTITDILDGALALKLLLLIFIFKGIALLVTLGSGTSGGLLAPMFMISAALGSAFAACVNLVIPSAHLSPGAFALVAMGAVFGAASRSTFAFIIFAFEITRDYNSVLPLMLVCVIADGIGVLMMRNSIMTEKLVRRGLRIHQEFETDVLQSVSVADCMAQPAVVSETMPLRELARRFAEPDGDFLHYEAVMLTDLTGQLSGILTQGDLLRALERHLPDSTPVIQVGSAAPVVTYPDETVHEAVSRMLHQNIGRLPVVSRKDPTRVVGFLGSANVLNARLHRLQEEHVREPGWLARISQ